MARAKVEEKVKGNSDIGQGHKMRMDENIKAQVFFSLAHGPPFGCSVYVSWLIPCPSSAPPSTPCPGLVHSGVPARSVSV